MWFSLNLFVFFVQGNQSSKLSVLSLMYCIVLPIMLFSKGELIWCFSFKYQHACGYHDTTSVETGCFPYFFITFGRNRCATNIFRSLDTLISRIFLSSVSIATHSQIYSEPALIIVSPITYTEIFFLLLDTLFGLYFCIHFQMQTWLLLTICKIDNAFAVFLKDKPRKYKYKP